jgi:hypothetical protein
MAITRSLANGFQLTDWTDEINNVDNQFGLISSMNLFATQGTSQDSIIFDKSITENTLLPAVDRRSGATTKAAQGKSSIFSLPLAYFKASDYITAADMQGIRDASTPEGAVQFAKLRVKKLESLRLQVDQSNEYMKLQAAKGIMKTPDGDVIANMFTEFGVTQTSIDFLLGTPGTDIDKKISELKRTLQTNLKTGAAVQGKPTLIVDGLFFDKLISHPNMRSAYLSYQNSGAQRMRDSTNTFMSWGSVDQFEHRGVVFMTYDATFRLPNGTTEAAVAANTGHLLPGVQGLFRGYFGPSNKLSQANVVGRELFAWEYTDPRDEQHEMQVETAPLFFCTQPQALIKVTTSN